MRCSAAVAFTAARNHLQAILATLHSSRVPTLDWLLGPGLPCQGHGAHQPTVSARDRIVSAAHVGRRAAPAGAASQPAVVRSSASMPARLPAATRPTGRAAIASNWSSPFLAMLCSWSKCIALQSNTCQQWDGVSQGVPVRKADLTWEEGRVTCAENQSTATSSSEAPPAMCVQPRSLASRMQCGG